MELAKKAIAMDDSIGHSLLGHLYSIQGDHEKMIAEGERLQIEITDKVSWFHVWSHFPLA